MPYNMYHILEIKVPAEQVFNALSQPNHLDNWWTLKSSGKPELNSEYNLNFTDAYNWFCKVSNVKENESFYLKMTKSDPDWNPTTFGFDLHPSTNGTMLNFSHINWPEANHHFKHSSFCWAHAFKRLKKLSRKRCCYPVRTA